MRTPVRRTRYPQILSVVGMCPIVRPCDEFTSVPLSAHSPLLAAFAAPTNIPQERPRRTTRPGARTLVDDLLRRQPRCAADRRTRRNVQAQRRRRVAMHAGVNRTFSVRARASRTVTPSAVPNQHARGERRDQGCARSSVHSSACVAGDDAPPIGERAAIRGRSATERGDERAVRRGALSELQLCGNREAALPEHNWMSGFASRRGHLRCAAHRRTRRNARARATEGGEEHAGVRRVTARAPALRTTSHGGKPGHIGGCSTESTAYSKTMRG